MAALVIDALLLASPCAKSAPRERIMIDDDWRFQKGDPAGNALSLLYDVRAEDLMSGTAIVQTTPAPPSEPP